MKRFKIILYVANPSGVILKAFHHAVDLAERNNARLTVIFVMETIPPYIARMTPHKLRQMKMDELDAALDAMIEWAAGRVAIEGKIVEGEPFLEVVYEVLRSGCDLVVKSVGENGDVSDWLFGTTDMHLLRKCPCPVWLIKSTGHTPIRRILAAVDFDDLDAQEQDSAEPLNRVILELAGSLAYLERSEFHVVHAWGAIGEDLMRSARTGIDKKDADSYVDEVHHQHRNWLDRLLRKAKKWIGSGTIDAVKPKTHVPKGRASEVIPALVSRLNIDLVVMGTVARTGIPGLIIGNTAETILRQIDCSVLAVKPPDFTTPVTLDEEPQLTSLSLTPIEQIDCPIPYKGQSHAG